MAVESVCTYALKKPFTYEDYQLERIELDFGKLTAKDDLAIVEELEAQNEIPTVPELSSDYRKLVVVRASGIPENVISALPMKEYMAIMELAGAYLMDGYGTASGEAFDFEKLNGNDCEEIEKKVKKAGKWFAKPAYNAEFQRQCAIKAGGLTEEELDKMSLKEHLKVRRLVRFFLAS